MTVLTLVWLLLACMEVDPAGEQACCTYTEVSFEIILRIFTRELNALHDYRGLYQL